VFVFGLVIVKNCQFDFGFSLVCVAFCDLQNSGIVAIYSVNMKEFANDRKILDLTNINN
jgi:hypothetical protein